MTNHHLVRWGWSDELLPRLALVDAQLELIEHTVVVGSYEEAIFPDISLVIVRLHLTVPAFYSAHTVISGSHQISCISFYAPDS